MDRTDELKKLIAIGVYYITKFNFNVIPIKDDKTPALKEWKKYQIKRISPNVFMSFFDDRYFKDKISAIAVITGKISGISVLDLDIYKFLDPTNSAQSDIEKLDILNHLTTPKAISGSGGRHYYFSYTPEIETGIYKENIDIRNDGGYIILPPSKTKKGAYSWKNDPTQTAFIEMPEELILDIKKHKVKANQIFKKEKLSLNFETNKEGERNNKTIRVMGLFLSHNRDNPDRALNLSRSYNEEKNQPPLDDKQILAMFNWLQKKDSLNRSKTNKPYTSNNLKKNLSRGFIESNKQGLKC